MTPEFAYGYDLDGVLAAAPPKDIFKKPWRKMNGKEREERRAALLSWYSKATVLFRPEEKKFVVITARKEDSEVRRVTEQWLGQLFGRSVSRLYMLSEGRNIENVVKFKQAAIMESNLTDFHEDNRTIVMRLRKSLGSEVRVWHFKKGRFYSS